MVRAARKTVRHRPKLQITISHEERSMLEELRDESSAALSRVLGAALKILFTMDRPEALRLIAAAAVDIRGPKKKA